MTLRLQHVTFLGVPLTEEVLVEELSPAALCGALGIEGHSEAKALKRLKELPEREHRDFLQLAERLWEASRLEKEELEHLASATSIEFQKSTPKDVIALRLIQKLGVAKAAELIERALLPTQVETKGTFMSYQTPGYDLKKIQPVPFVSRLQETIRVLFSKTAGGERRVKVRAHQPMGQLVVQVFFERPDKDGREITNTNELKLKNFERSAGFTYFRLVPSGDKGLLTLRAPMTRLAQHIREALGRVLWDDPGIIPSTPARVYNLEMFKDPKVRLTPVEHASLNVSAVTLQNIEVLASTGNLIRVAARGREGDALRDFQQLAHSAPVLTQGSEVRFAELKLSYQRDGERQRSTRVRVTPTVINLDEDHLHVVEAHLRSWGILTDG
jgi:hypothetical protein